METEKHTIWGRIRKALKKRLVAGILIILPIYITYFVIKTLFSFVGSYFSPIVKRVIESSGYKLPDFAVTLISLISTFVFLYFIGLFATNVVGRRIIHYFEMLVNKMPLIKTVYGSTKQVIQTATLPGSLAFKRVVLVEFPREGVKAIGFLTGDTKIGGDKKFYSIFIPTVPNPTTGYQFFFAEKEVVKTSLSIEDGIKMLLSCCILTPPKLA